MVQGLGFFKRILWAFILLLFQVLVFNHIHLFGYATPLVYVYVLVLQPLNTSRVSWLLWGFLMGVAVDFFSETPGLAASSMTFTALCAPVLLQLFAPKDSIEDMVPSYSTLNRWGYIWYVSLLVLLQQFSFLLAEMFSFFNVWEWICTFVASSMLTVILILVAELMRSSKE